MKFKDPHHRRARRRNFRYIGERREGRDARFRRDEQFLSGGKLVVPRPGQRNVKLHGAVFRARCCLHQFRQRHE